MNRSPTIPPRARALIIAAVRRWRRARDRGEAVQPALFATLEPAGCGVLAPVLDGLIQMFESSSGRSFEVAPRSDGGLSVDERRLLAMLEADDSGVSPAASVSRRLGTAMQVAVRSTRIMIRLALRASAPGLSVKPMATLAV